jgi:hypothetical protein
VQLPVVLHPSWLVDSPARTPCTSFHAHRVQVLIAQDASRADALAAGCDTSGTSDTRARYRVHPNVRGSSSRACNFRFRASGRGQLSSAERYPARCFAVKVSEGVQGDELSRSAEERFESMPMQRAVTTTCSSWRRDQSMQRHGAGRRPVGCVRTSTPAHHEAPARPLK